VGKKSRRDTRPRGALATGKLTVPGTVRVRLLLRELSFTTCKKRRGVQTVLYKPYSRGVCISVSVVVEKSCRNVLWFAIGIGMCQFWNLIEMKISHNFSPLAGGCVVLTGGQNAEKS